MKGSNASARPAARRIQGTGKHVQGNPLLTPWAAEALGLPITEAPREALSLRPPWWWFILNLGKDIENRCWESKREGWVFIHAALNCTRNEWDVALRTAEQAVLRGPTDKLPNRLAVLDELPGKKEIIKGGIVGAMKIEPSKPSSSAWAFPHQSHIRIVEARPLPFQPCIGSLGFFVPNVSQIRTDTGEEAKVDEGIPESELPPLAARVGYVARVPRKNGRGFWWAKVLAFTPPHYLKFEGSTMAGADWWGDGREATHWRLPKGS